MDALQSFTYLTDNIPTWLTDLDELNHQISIYQSEISDLTKRENSLKRAKSGSTESLRLKDKENDNGDGDPPAGTSRSPRNGLKTQLQAQQIQRKRKTGSMISGPSGPNKYRTRSMILVYYDSAVQKAFEGLVRNIGTARNNLRKGKMAARMKQMSAMVDNDESPFQMPGRRNGYSPKMAFPRAGRRQEPSAGQGGAPDIFEMADKNLEKSQSLCEVGAHQFLRDGECTVEIDGTREAFERVLADARKEVERLREEERLEQEKARQREGADRNGGLGGDDGSSKSSSGESSYDIHGGATH